MRTVNRTDLIARLRKWIAGSSRYPHITMTRMAALEIATALESREPTLKEPTLKEPETRVVQFVRNPAVKLDSWGCKNCGLNFSVVRGFPVEPTACPYCRMKISDFVIVIPAPEEPNHDEASATPTST